VTADQILLWRHGRTASNADGRFQGQQDVPLDDVGLVQVKEAAELLAAQIGTTRCRLVSSDLSRAMVTAQALADRLGIPVYTDPELREVNAGAWEGLLRTEIAATFPRELADWRAGEDVKVGGGERRSEAGARAERAIRRHAAQVDGGVLVIASHGAALRGALMRLLDLDAWAWNVLDGLQNAHWADLRRRGDGWILSAYNVGSLDDLAGGTR
jgi:broad specificity phosphatase PhoE